MTVHADHYDLVASQWASDCIYIYTWLANCKWNHRIYGKIIWYKTKNDKFCTSQPIHVCLHFMHVLYCSVAIIRTTRGVLLYYITVHGSVSLLSWWTVHSCIIIIHALRVKCSHSSRVDHKLSNLLLEICKQYNNITWPHISCAYSLIIAHMYIYMLPEWNEWCVCHVCMCVWGVGGGMIWSTYEQCVNTALDISFVIVTSL